MPRHSDIRINLPGLGQHGVGAVVVARATAIDEHGLVPAPGLRLLGAQVVFMGEAQRRLEVPGSGLGLAPGRRGDASRLLDQSSAGESVVTGKRHFGDAVVELECLAAQAQNNQGLDRKQQGVLGPTAAEAGRLRQRRKDAFPVATGLGVAKVGRQQKRVDSLAVRPYCTRGRQAGGGAISALLSPLPNGPGRADTTATKPSKSPSHGSRRVEELRSLKVASQKSKS